MQDDNEIENPSFDDGATLDRLIEQRYSRRQFIDVGAKFAMVVAGGSLAACDPPQLAGDEPLSPQQKGLRDESGFNFIEINHGADEHHQVAPDHQAQILLRWGDAVFSDSPEFDPENQSPDAQERQFGYNNDYIGYLPLAPDSDGRARALLCVNHEYPSSSLMFPDMQGRPISEKTANMIGVEQAAVGNSIIEIRCDGGSWYPVADSPYNRRISARSTEIDISGPAAAHPRLKTTADPGGTRVIGTLNNCAGGMTPWGTYLTCEENFNVHFSGELEQGHVEADNYRRYGLQRDRLGWGHHDARFNLSQEPNEPNRFGWVVEIDPLDPESVPKKRTALGRFKHEGAETVLAPDGRAVVYMGDDQRFDYVYKFVTKASYHPENKEMNQDLLDEGALYVARFNADGWLDWLPLEFGRGPLTEANGFDSQADVLIRARLAADMLGATPMDRPEDLQPVAATGKVYIMLTNNTQRTDAEVDASNPRGPNTFGHILEISEPQADFTALRSRWDMVIRAGDPSQPEQGALWHEQTSKHGWFASPDNGAVDPSNRLWVSTDQGDKWRLSGTSDGLWALQTGGALRGTGKMFFRCPIGAELCGPQFSPDGENLFVAVQHPGALDDAQPPSTYENPATRWPDFDDRLPPRPSVVVITRRGGGRVG